MKHLFCDVIGQTFYDGAKGGGRGGSEGVPAKEDPYCWIFTHKWHLSTSCQSEISRDMHAFLHDRGININVIGLANEDFVAMNIQQCGSLLHTLPNPPKKEQKLVLWLLKYVTLFCWRWCTVYMIKIIYMNCQKIAFTSVCFACRG